MQVAGISTNQVGNDQSAWTGADTPTETPRDIDEAQGKAETESVTSTKDCLYLNPKCKWVDGNWIHRAKICMLLRNWIWDEVFKNVAHLNGFEIERSQHLIYSIHRSHLKLHNTGMQRTY